MHRASEGDAPRPDDDPVIVYEPLYSPPGWEARLAPMATIVVVVGATIFTFFQLHPGLIFGPGTDVGGDNAAHIVASAYLIHDLLPHGQLSGWDPEWFGGFPLYVFYFPLPAVLIAALYPIFHFAVAFKIVSILGTLLMPTAVYVFGRCAGFARPVPALMAATSLAFLFNTSYTIDGGNIASTLAGEFSFTLSVAFGIMFLGVFALSLRTGRLRWLAALLYTATVLSHVVPGIFFGLSAILLTLAIRRTRQGVKTLVAVGLVGCLLAAFWLLRFGADIRYTSSMGYNKVTDPFGAAGLLPHSAELAVQILAALGLCFAAIKRDRIALVLAAMAIASALAFIYLPSGVVYNGRWLPFWFLSTSLLAAYGLGAIGRAACALCRVLSANEWATPVIATIAITAVIAGYLGILPRQDQANGSASLVPDWTSWNYSGYQAKEGWPEFQRLFTMLDNVGARYGCGNLDYEYTPNVNTYFGSTIVEMSFPYWTNGCIDSAEGLYYESSTSTPFHFLDQSELSIQPSNPIPDLPYQSLNVADGIRHLQLTGVRYFLANSPEVETQAAADPALTEVASTAAIPSEIDGVTSGSPSPANPRWIVYEIHDSALVTPLTHDPVVEPGISKTKWLSTAIEWYQHPADWPVELAMNGPQNWPRVAPGTVVGPGGGTPVGKTTVSSITETYQKVSFHVTTTGVPVMVKIPYFPNWQASGASGPWPVSPNLMVVVPTSHVVTLTYGTTTVDWLGRAGSVIGLVGLVGLRGRVEPGRGPEDPESGIPSTSGNASTLPEVRSRWRRRVGRHIDEEADATDGRDGSVDREPATTEAWSGREAGRDLADVGGPREGATSKTPAGASFDDERA